MLRRSFRTLGLVRAAVTSSAPAAVAAVRAMGTSAGRQGRGHRREREAPAPFAGPGDFLARFLAEQWVTFPRFVLSGGCYRNLRRVPPSQSSLTSRTSAGMPAPPERPSAMSHGSPER
jgi:hypothetical protein